MESEFENFKNRVLKKYRVECEKKLKKAESYRSRLIEKAHSEGKRVYKKELSLFLERLKNEKRKRLFDIQLEAKREVSKKYATLEKEALKELKNRIDSDFEQFVICFSRWLRKNFREGNVKTNRQYAQFFEGYPVEIIVGKKVIFFYKNVYIEFSPEKLIENYKDKIRVLLSKLIKER
ncbi:hypothetical protein SAMN06265182_1493 [Persephonella hydrogeniphila]|uniref:Uncharacterized protein n=1 Tax=Persephonella hydrogeniphila TaxID=198703 RepID=A0A285NNE7_9AQUI|nr:hypothetical protein [Persephonella hydrogeniphila]SNZ09161.1 hypothetical protein SAMN06265182_1493 [Persephonella hydrogeniphila]